jgi:hypothetical protein
VVSFRLFLGLNNYFVEIRHKVRLPSFLFVIDFFKLFAGWRIYKTIVSLILFCSVTFCPEVKSAFEKKEAGASSSAIGNAAVAIDGFIFALYYNPAALSTSEKIHTAFTVQNFFSISDLNSVDLIMDFTLADYPFSLAINRFGNRLYHELQFTLGSRIEVVKDFAIGFSLQSYILAIKGYGHTITWGANVGILYKFLPLLSVGALVTNINRPGISATKEQLPQTMSIGLCYLPTEKLMLSFEIFQDIKYQPEFRAGCEYHVIPLLTIRAGVEDQLDSFCYGLGIHINWIAIDYSLRTHPVLGLSHIATLSLIL